MIKVNNDLTSGVFDRDLVVINNDVIIVNGEEISNTTGNYWVDWAIGFQSFCINTLGLEVQDGPGTSVGIIQSNMGPVRFQYDCDWNEPFGRVKTFNGQEHYVYQENGYTLWSDDENTLWGNITRQNGIDSVNRRFDFIVWFTVQDETKGRIGLRFKYPITTERGYSCPYYISSSPFIQPWYEKGDKTAVNYYRINDTWGEYSSSSSKRTAVISLSSDNLVSNSYAVLAGRYLYAATKTFQDEDGANKLWTEYSQGLSGTYSYETLGGEYASDGDASFSKLMAENPSHLKCFVSKNKQLINIKILNNSGKVELDILYGDLMDDNGEVNSFIEVKNHNSHTPSGGSTIYDMDNFLITDNHYNVRTSNQINRPTSTAVNDYSKYWGITRVLLQEETKHCAELYQVFSFADTMSKHLYKQINFIDTNNEIQPFIVFNYGTQNSNNNFFNATLLAMPI